MQDSELNYTCRFIEFSLNFEPSGLNRFISRNYICNIEGARVFHADGVIAMVDLCKIEDERIRRFIETFKHREELINVAFLSCDEWELLKNFVETIGGEMCIET